MSKKFVVHVSKFLAILKFYINIHKSCVFILCGSCPVVLVSSTVFSESTVSFSENFRTFVLISQCLNFCADISISQNLYTVMSKFSFFRHEV